MSDISDRICSQSKETCLATYSGDDINKYNFPTNAFMPISQIQTRTKFKKRGKLCYTQSNSLSQCRLFFCAVLGRKSKKMYESESPQTNFFPLYETKSPNT